MVLIIALFTIHLIRHNFSLIAPGQYHAHPIGDWLINYAGGFVRRGFSGSIIILLAEILNIRPELIVVLTVISIFIVFHLSLAIFMLRQQTFRIIDALILFSPLFLSYEIFNTDFTGRKEILLSAWMSINLVRASLGKSPFNPSTHMLVLLVFVLFHEGIIFFAPFAFIAIQRMYHPSISIRDLLHIILPSAIYVLALPLFSAPVTSETVQAIARRINDTNFQPWTRGAIGVLQSSAYNSFMSIAGNIHASQVWNVLKAVGLCLLPLMLLKKSEPIFKQRWRDILLVILAILCQVPIYTVAIDWGRWLSMFAITLGHYYFATHITAPQQIYQRPTNNFLRHWQLCLLIPLLVIYSTSWSVPGCCMSGVIPGILARQL